MKLDQKKIKENFFSLIMDGNKLIFLKCPKTLKISNCCNRPLINKPNPNLPKSWRHQLPPTILNRFQIPKLDLETVALCNLLAELHKDDPDFDIFREELSDCES